MSLQVEKLEKNMAKLTIEVSAEDLDKAMEKAYQKQKSRISLPGFRKGKAPRKMIESMYGKGVFMEDAVNSLVPQEYTKALGECDLEIVSQPEINVTQMEPGKALIFTADVAVKPEVTLGDYKGVEVPKSEIAVTDEKLTLRLRKSRIRMQEQLQLRIVQLQTAISQQSISRDLLMVLHLKAVKELTTHLHLVPVHLSRDSRISLLEQTLVTM